jgi:ATP-dependent RNA helicase DHX36
MQVSRASAQQRRGRAGRCQPGVCFHLYSRTRYASLAAFQLPEIKRSPLEELCLQVKLMEEAATKAAGDGAVPRSIGEFIAAAVEPPLPQAVSNAVSMLSAIGALTVEEQLTSLGRHLAHLPLNPAIGKLLLYGALFHVLDPILTVACRAGTRSPFILPSGAIRSHSSHWLCSGQEKVKVAFASLHVWWILTTLPNI